MPTNSQASISAIWNGQSSPKTWKISSNRDNPFLQQDVLKLSIARRIIRLRLSLKRWLESLVGWRKAIAYGCVCAVFALVCNITILIWAHTKPKGTNSDAFVLYNGDCEDIKPITIWSHLGINIISTLILSGSNYAMQVIMAPTRVDADAAHESERSVSIGVLDFSNWKFLGLRRRLLYFGLLLTSIPFHTIYNSVIFDTTSAVNFGLYLVTDDFFNSEPRTSNKTAPLSSNLGYTVWTRATQNHWDNLTKDDCYGLVSSSYVHNYLNLILVTDISSHLYNQSWLADTHQLSGIGAWLCNSWNCNPNTTAPENWDIALSAKTQSSNSVYSANIPGTYRVSVQYCIAEPTHPSCTIELSPQLLGVAIACNIVKVIILIMLLYSDFTPLVTIGDAIASYLNEPDASTKDWGATSTWRLCRLPDKTKLVAVNNLLLDVSVFHIGFRKVPWKNERPRYFSGATALRWTLTLNICILCLSFGMAMLVLAVSFENPRQAWQEGLDSIAPRRLLSWHLGFLATVVIVNTPQLLFSLVYLFYNSTLTSLLVSQEWTNYARYRKGLRVTKPEGAQRSTFFLSLPYRFSIPLLLVSAFLHWSLSQSFFFAQVNFLKNDGSLDLADSILTAGFSVIGLLILVSLGVILITALLFFGFRHYESGIPLVLSNSRAISAACHPIAQNDKEENPALKGLKYGVMADLGLDRYHVGFSSGPVEPLVDGRFYDGRREPVLIQHPEQRYNSSNPEVWDGDF